MEAKQQSEQRFALLIDAENVSAKYIKPILSELSKYGTVTYKRIYGDWTQSLHARWKDALLENSITPIQQFSYTSGKNSTDSAMIIDAMDILYTGDVEGFCLVSSDSDFTRLASRLRESGVTVIGMGERKTPKPFRTACDIFTTLEVINAHHRKVARDADSEAPSAEEVEQAVVDIVTDNNNNGKSTGLGEVGSRLLKVYPDFDVRSFGTGPLSQLLESFVRVNVIRDGNNINVELAEVPPTEAEPAAVEAPKAATRETAETTGRRRRSRSHKTIGAKPVETSAEAQAAEADADAKAEETRKADKAADKPAEKAAAKVETAETPAKGETAVKTDKAEAAAKAEAETTEAKPQRTGRGRRGRRGAGAAKAAKAEAAADVAKTETEVAEAPADAAKAAAEPAAPKAETPVEAAKAATGAKTPKRRGRKPRMTGTPADEASDPKSYIRELVKASGEEGVNIDALNRQLRSRFRGFKIRDLGFTRINNYIENQRGMTVVTRGDDSFAILKSAMKKGKAAPKTGPKTEPEALAEPKSDRKSDGKSATKTDVKADEKPEPKAEAKADAKSDKNADAKAESK